MQFKVGDVVFMTKNKNKYYTIKNVYDHGRLCDVLDKEGTEYCIATEWLELFKPKYSNFLEKLKEL